MGVAIHLDGYEGPLDLLVHLIQKNKIDIYDIPIAEITNQYLIKIKEWQEFDLDVASDFIIMAARLLEIKSQSLLPIENQESDDQESLKEKLVKQLIDYKIFKEISVYFGQREDDKRAVIYRDPEYILENEIEESLIIKPIDLFQSFQNLLLMKDDQIEEIIPHQEIVRELFSVEEKIFDITKVLLKAGGNGVKFSELLFPGISREEVVVTLLALLEMVKINGLRLEQNRVFFDFKIKREATYLG
jgi:segregation and condensation protein A